MEFFELKLIEKIGQVFSIAMHDRKYNRYQFIKKWCFSNTCHAVFDFDEGVNIIVPSIELQNEFADYAKFCDKLKFEVQKKNHLKYIYIKFPLE